MLLLLPLLLHVYIEVNLEWHKHGATSVNIDGVHATGLGSQYVQVAEGLQVVAAVAWVVWKVRE
jgi:hypothetical protein